MPKIRFTDISTGTTQDADADLPIDAKPYGGSEATVRPKVYRTAAASAVVLPPVNQFAPSIAGTPAVSSILSLSGFDWDGATSFAYRWYSDGVLAGTGETYTTQTGDQGKTITAEMQGVGAATSGWVAATNVVFIPIVAMAVVTADEWETYEAPADADTRKTFMRIDDTPSAGFEFGFWRSATPGPEDVTLTSLGAFTFVTDHYEALSSGRNPIGTPAARSTQYVRIAERNIADPTNTGLWRWVSETKTYLSSSTPAAPVVSVTQGAAEGEIIVNITTLADPSDRAITRYEYLVDGAGSWIDLGGGLGIGARSLLGFTPLQSYTIEVRAVNANGNGTATAAATILAGQPPLPPPTVTTLVFGAQQFVLDGPYTVVTHVDGPKCIVSASPVTILSKAPDVIPTAGAIRNGCVKNPTLSRQAFDTRVKQTWPTELITFPATLSPGDILLSAVSLPDATVLPGERFGYVDSYDMVYVATSAPNPLSLAPSPVGWTGRGTPAVGPIVDYAAKAALLPTTYGVSGYTYGDEARVDRALRYNPGLAFSRGTFSDSTNVNCGYQAATPYIWGSPGPTSATSASSNYSQFTNNRLAEWMWHLAAPVAQVPLVVKAKILMRIHSFAWLTQANWDGKNITMNPSGDGQSQTHQGPFALAHWLTGDDVKMDELMVKHPGCWEFFFKFTDAMIPEWFQPWGDADNLSTLYTQDYPSSTFRRRILAVDATAKTVTLAHHARTGYANSQGGSAKARFVGLLLTRESDSASAKILTGAGDLKIDPREPVVLPLETWPTPGFAIGEIVTMQSPWTPNVGDPEWRVGLETNYYNPSALTSYRDQQDVLPYLAFLRVLGVHRPEWQAVWEYGVLANGTGWPRSDQDFPSTSPGGMFNLIWAAHKAAIEAVPQPLLP